MAESIFKETTDSDDLAQRIENLESQISSLNPRNLAGLKAKELRAAVRANIFGDGSDGEGTISTNSSLTRDFFYNNLTIDSSAILNTNGFRLFVKGDLIIKSGSSISVNGNDGADGNDGPAGGAGGSGGAAAHSSGSLPASLAGKAGGSLQGNNEGEVGTAGDGVVKGLGANGAAGGAGGAGETNPGTQPSGGAAGTISGTVFNVPRSPQAAYMLHDTQPSDTFDVLRGSASSGSGAAGNDATVGPGTAGGGGGSGSPGGMMVIFANRIINEGTISANGGNGGDGGDSDGNDAGGGGGGAGGSGGVIILVYGTKSGAGTYTVTAGTGGIAGTSPAGGDGTDGDPGADGNDGTLIEIEVG